jgi:type VI secretion system protein ImpK
MNDFSKTIITQTLELNLSDSQIKEQSLSNLCTDLLLIIIKMRETTDLGETAALRKLVNYYISQFHKNCLRAGFAPEMIELVKYALVATLDETVLSIPGEARDFWITNPMQLEIFGDNIAGEEFYRKLDQLMQAPDENRSILEIYYLCLCLGFQGRYLLKDPQQREVIIKRLASILVKREAAFDTLSPHAIRTNLFGRSLGVKSDEIVPLWAVGGIMATVLMIVWVVLSLLVGDLG